MLRLAPLSALAFSAVFTASAAAQATVVSTRTFTQEVFELANFQGNFFGNIELSGLGLDDHSTTHGAPALIEVQLDVQWDIDLEITSQLPFADFFCYSVPIYLSPVTGDCAGCAQSSIFEQSAIAQPGDTVSLLVNNADSFAWTGSAFNTGCGVPWNWQDLNLWSDPFLTSPIKGRPSSSRRVCALREPSAAFPVASARGAYPSA